jgi:hypothetical protein
MLIFERCDVSSREHTVVTMDGVLEVAVVLLMECISNVFY